jgi:hypothetical protein
MTEEHEDTKGGLADPEEEVKGNWAKAVYANL